MNSSEEDRIAVNMGGAAPPTPAPGGIGGTGITYFAQVPARDGAQTVIAPPPSPEESNGVSATTDLLIADLDMPRQTMSRC